MRERKPLPDVEPGFMKKLVPSEPPLHGEEWSKIFADIEPVAFNGNTNWHHPHFYAYFPTALSYPSIMADILSGGISSIGFSYNSSPAMTELEMSMTDWLAKAVNLPDNLLNSHEGPGCGIIQSTASDATLVAILAARARAVIKLSEENSRSLKEKVAPQDGEDFTSNMIKAVQGTVGHLKQKITESVNTRSEKSDLPTTFKAHDPSLFTSLVAYTSDQGHSSVEKGAMLAGVRIRKIKSNTDNERKNYSICPEALEEAIKNDVANGYTPFILIASVGTTNTCAVDPIEKLGPICNAHNIWLHVDAAYAGSFALLPEFRYLLKGIEFADSFNFNAHKAMAINFDCSPMWFKDATEAVAFFNVDPLYLKHKHQTTSHDYRHLQIALGRRFRSLKIWFVLRSMGIEGIQKHLRGLITSGERFHQLIAKDERFELFVPHHVGLTCFRLKNKSNEENEKLCNAINDDRRIHLVPSKVNDTYFLRVVICSQLTTVEDVEVAYKVIVELANKYL
uniref:Aromatic-L-amino-acid decarboxylase n=1 Tax=Rhabditophanes sp. KR3021 TaxID=114890 RepID=A0AC35U3D4_9BILA